MKIKSYFAATVESAIAQARQEFGPEAMLMNSRKAATEAKHLGEYEVVFACPNASEEKDSGPDDKRDLTSSGSAVPDPLLKEIADLRRQFERMASGIARAKSIISPALLSDPLIAALFSSLLAAEVDASIANHLVNVLRSGSAGRTSTEDLGRRLRTEVENMASSDSTLGRSGHPRIVAFVGPPGSGKTSCLVKTAIHFGSATRKPSQFLTIDTERIAAADQLHTFAQILGTGFSAVESPHALAQAIEEHKNKDLILIDTPGVGPRDAELLESLAGFFSRREDIDVHLVLPAHMKPVDLAATADRFADLYPHKLVFTKLDETTTYGAILSESMRTGKPVSFLSTGQQIPEDLEPATKSRIATLVLGDLTSKASVIAA